MECVLQVDSVLYGMFWGDLEWAGYIKGRCRRQGRRWRIFVGGVQLRSVWWRKAVSCVPFCGEKANPVPVSHTGYGAVGSVRISWLLLNTC